ncbi:MAG: hypothetical protein ACRYE9_00140 [Janthinobacterium lividum]
MINHYWIEFIPSTLQTVNTRANLSIDYLYYIHNHNINNKQRHTIFAIPTSWYAENEEHTVPRSLIVQNKISDNLLLQGVVLAKKRRVINCSR